MSEKANFRALLPMIVFLVLFIGTGIALTAAGADMPFYQLSATVAIIPAIVLAILQGKDDLNKKIGVFLSGVGEINIITMCMIFLLAGGFASVASAIGGVKATVNFGLSLLPPSMILPGLFLIGAFISTAMGTSMGTVAAIAPIAVGVGEQTDIPLALLLGVVMSGAMFGDNLSMISDTTIAATRTQGCEMKDKFRMNLLIALPAALVTLALLWFAGASGQVVKHEEYQFIRVVPYLAILVMALAGVNVFIVLLGGHRVYRRGGYCLCGRLYAHPVEQGYLQRFCGHERDHGALHAGGRPRGAHALPRRYQLAVGARERAGPEALRRVPGEGGRMLHQPAGIACQSVYGEQYGGYHSDGQGGARNRGFERS